MKISSARFLLMILPLLAGGHSILDAASAAITAHPATITRESGNVEVAVECYYSGTPTALGGELSLPRGWSLAGISGPDKPQIASSIGTTGQIEVAWMAPPAGQAKFTLTLAHPDDAAPAVLKGRLLLRQTSGGEELALELLLQPASD